MATSEHTVLVRGESVAAAAVAELLRQAGTSFVRGRAREGEAGQSLRQNQGEAARVPAVMVGAGTRQLLRDIWTTKGEEQTRDLWPIARRVVRWGDRGGTGEVGREESVVVPHQGWVIAGEQMGRLVSSGGGKAGCEEDANEEGVFTIYAGGPGEAVAGGRWERVQWGQRTARTFAVRLREGADAQACVAEALTAGWLFLLPVGPREAWLLLVGEYAELGAALEESGPVARRLEPRTGEGAREGRRFACAPWLANPVGSGGTEGWLCCGAAAAGFDPLGGDGVGNALREAILAAAVTQYGKEKPEQAEAAMAHYVRQLRAGMLRHLEQLLPFYGQGGEGAWWQAQREATAEGAALVRAWLQESGPPRFGLRGFSLQPL